MLTEPKFQLIEKNYYEAINHNDKLDRDEIFKVAKLFTNTHDVPFYNRIRSELDHLFYKQKIGLVKSHRNLFITSDECMTTIQFIRSLDKLYINVYARSSNYKESYNEDIGFICDYIKNNFIESKIELNYLTCSLHFWRK